MCVPSNTITGVSTSNGGRQGLLPKDEYYAKQAQQAQVNNNLPLAQLQQQAGFQDVSNLNLSIPIKPPVSTPVISRNSAYDTQYTLGADGVKRAAPQGFASLRIDRKVA